MLRALFHLVINTLIILILSSILPGFQVASFGTAFLFVVILSLLNAVVLPVIKLFTFPINLITLGIFNLVLNLGVILFVVNILKGVTLSGNYFLNLFVILVALTIGSTLGKFVE
jgi:putative membrane protein